MTAIPDPATWTSLENGYFLAWAVDEDGEPWPWLVASLCADCARTAVNGNYFGARHERTGPSRTQLEAQLVDREVGLPQDASQRALGDGPGRMHGNSGRAAVRMLHDVVAAPDAGDDEPVPL